MKLSFKEFIKSKYNMSDSEFEQNMGYITNYMFYNGHHLEDCFESTYNRNNVCMICTMQNYINDYNDYCINNSNLQIQEGLTLNEICDRDDDVEFLERYNKNFDNLLRKLGNRQNIKYLKYE